MSDLIIIDITESEKVDLDGSSHLRDIRGEGKISIKNPTQKSRLWNLNCDLKEIVNTNLSSRELEIGIINSNQTHDTNYEIKDLKEPSLNVSEEFDTDLEIPAKMNDILRYNMDNKCKLTLHIKNPLEQSITNIKLSREIPQFFQELEIQNPNMGVAGLVEKEGKRYLNWDIVSLEEGKIAKLDIICIIHPENSEVKSLGALDVSYLINNYKLTYLSPEIRGLTDSMSGIDRDESSQPGLWECNVEFINDSEFQIRLEEVKVSQRITTGAETVVSQNPNRLLNPGQEWNYSFQIESKDVPELNSTIGFTPLYVVITRVNGEIHKEPTIYSVLNASIEKTINPAEVDAYANTEIKIENMINNSGTSMIKMLELSDELPSDFIPPLLNQIRIQMGDIDITARSEYTKVLEIIPDDQNPEIKHSIHLILDNLQFSPKSNLLIFYPLKARNPRPPTEILYKTPVTLKVNSLIEGKYYKTIPAIQPEIKVRYVKRKLKTLKSIKPGTMEGEFTVSLRIQNKGSVELENIIIKDKIPQGFDLTEINRDTYKLESMGDYSELEVKLDELKGNESLSLTYSCTGQGDYPRYEPLVSVLGRSSAEKKSSQIQQSSPSSEIKVSEIPIEVKATINDVFQEIYKKIDQTITGNDLGNFIEKQRDKFPPGPILHQFMRYANDIKSFAPEKIIVGSTREKVLLKLREFQQKYK